MLRTLRPILAVLALAVPSAVLGQLPTDDPVEVHKKWYDRQLERADLIPGTFDVLRFPTKYTFTPRYKHDPKKRKRILNPDFRCNRCAEEGRIPAEARLPDRMMERDASDLMGWAEKELKRSVTVIEDGTFKLCFALPGTMLKEFPNPFLEQELAELGDVFPEVSDKTVAVNDHQRAHLYIIRAHRLLRDFLWTVGTTESAIRSTYPHLGPHLGMNNKQEIYVFPRQREYVRFSNRYIGRSSADGQCWHMFHDRCMIFAMHAQGYPDPQVQNFFLHRLQHNLLDAYRMYSFKLPAWLQMGMGHWVERRESLQYNSFCFSEGTIPQVLFRTRWEPRVKKMVMKDDVQPFVSLCSHEEYGNFPIEYHMICYSWVCYLWRLGPEKMKVFINALKAKADTETLYQAQVRGFRMAYGISPLQFDEGWREWVKATYPDL